ncbi:hypothetical protein DHEL01_v202686 [Diaporthe helianthi]|uniref:2EXR domain-containing protein n=1 Tax=Diaporthe helianthi TaxID=158607 RepID=A0A2P5I8U2_DIAHE|nr:hypothetical protein DHEL01_v202686 [Diaporthe helianthi]
MANDTNATAAAFSEAHANGRTHDGNCDVSTRHADKMDQPPAAVERSAATSTKTPTDTDDGEIVFKQFKNLPIEVRSMIWKLAAHNAKPCGVYSFECAITRMPTGTASPEQQDLADEVEMSLYNYKVNDKDPLALLDLHRLGPKALTLTPSANVANMTRNIRALFASCPEARRELMCDPRLSSSFEFDYSKFEFGFSTRPKCHSGTIRPFCYDTDWVSMEGLDRVRLVEEDAELPSTRCTPDLSRIQHLAVPFASDCTPGLPRRSVWRRLAGLRSIGLYAPSFWITDVPFYDGMIPPEERVFLRGFPVSACGTVSGPTMSNRDRGYLCAIRQLRHVLTVVVGRAKTKKSEPLRSGACDFAGLKFAVLVHADSQEGMELTRFREDGGHLQNVDLNGLGEIGQLLESLQKLG